MATPRDEPYVWVTWITKLMAGEAHCDWAAWFRAHHTYDRLPGDFDLATWTAQHTTLLRDRVIELKREGFKVLIEAQNAFKLRGSRGVVLAGKPDLVAVRGDEALVVDCKTGSPKSSDHFQVLIYMIVLPLTHPACKGKTLEGELQYRNDTVRIPSSKVTDELRQLFRDTMNRLGGAAALDRVPSYDECRFCDIGVRDCADRIETRPSEAAPDHDLF